MEHLESLVAGDGCNLGMVSPLSKRRLVASWRRSWKRRPYMPGFRQDSRKRWDTSSGDRGKILSETEETDFSSFRTARARGDKGTFRLEPDFVSSSCATLLSRSTRSHVSERIWLLLMAVSMARRRPSCQKSRVIRSNPFLLTIALQDPLLFWKYAIFDHPPGEIIGWKDPKHYLG